MGRLRDEVNARLAEAASAESGIVSRNFITADQRRDIHDLRTRLAPRVPLFERMGFNEISDVRNFNAEIQGTRVGRIFFGLEAEGTFRSPNQNGLLRAIGDQFQPNQTRGSVIDQLNADLNANPSLEPRLRRAIKENPGEIARILPQYNAANGAAGTRILTQTLDRLAPAPGAGPAARTDDRPARPTDPVLTREQRNAFERQLNVFSNDPDTTPEEQQYMRNLIARERNDGGGITISERDAAIAKMNRFKGAAGDQRTAAERAQFQPGAAPPPPAAPVDGAAPPPPPAAPAEPPPPPAYVPPNTLDHNSYGELMGNLGRKVAVLIPEGMGEGNDAAGFLRHLEDPAFEARFIQQYNSDPQYRRAIQLLYSDADRLAQASERNGGRPVDPNTPMGQRIGLLQGEFRTFLTNPDYLLDVNRVMTLEQNARALVSSTTGFAAMAERFPLFRPILEVIEAIMGPIRQGGGMAGLGNEIMGGLNSILSNFGIGTAGNGGNEMLSGLMRGLGLGGSDAGTGAPAAGTALASADTTRTVPPPGLVPNGGAPAPPVALT